MRKIMVLLVLFVAVCSASFADDNIFKTELSGLNTLTVTVKPGLNMLQGFHPSRITKTSEITAKDIEAVYMFVPDISSYVQVYPVNELADLSDIASDSYYGADLVLYAQWVLIKPGVKSHSLTYQFQRANLGTIPLKVGWNFVGVNPNMFVVDVKSGIKTMNWQTLAGDCTFAEIYYWDGAAWVQYDTTVQTGGVSGLDPYLCQGMLIRVEQPCTLRK